MRIPEKVTDYEGDIKVVRMVRNLLVENGILFFSAGFGGKFQFHHHLSNPEKKFGKFYNKESVEKLFSEFKEVKRQHFIESNEKCDPCRFERVNEIIYPKT